MASGKGKPARRKRNTASSSLHPSDQWISIETGNYKGQWNHRTMSGEGIYAKLDGKITKTVRENTRHRCISTFARCYGFDFVQYYLYTRITKASENMKLIEFFLV